MRTLRQNSGLGEFAMKYEWISRQCGGAGWALCLQSAHQAGISPAAVRHAMMVHHAKHQTMYTSTDHWDSWAEWAYCLEKAGLPEDEIARARQAYFTEVTHAMHAGLFREQYR